MKKTSKLGVVALLLAMSPAALLAGCNKPSEESSSEASVSSAPSSASVCVETSSELSLTEAGKAVQHLVVGDTLDLGTLLATRPVCAVIAVEGETSNVGTDSSLVISADAVGDFKVKISAGTSSVEVSGNIISKELDKFRKAYAAAPISNNYTILPTQTDSGKLYTIGFANYYNANYFVTNAYAGKDSSGNATYQQSGRIVLGSGEAARTYPLKDIVATVKGSSIATLTSAGVEAYKTNAIGSDTDTPLFDLTGADFVDQIDAEGKGTGLIVYTGEKADNIINEYTGYYFGTETNGDTASLQAAYNDDGSLKGVYLQQYKGTTDTTYGVAISAIGSTSFAALDTMVTSTAQPSPIPCTELSTVIASLQSAKNYTATTALSYLDSTGAAVTDATKLKTLEDGFVGYIPDTFTAYTDGASFYTTEASDGAIDAYLMHDSKPYEVYNTDSTGAILADGKFSADDLSTYGSDVWSITPNIGVVESSALATLNVFSATVSGTVTTYVYDYVDNADLQLEMNYQHAMIGPSFSNNILPDLVKYGYVMNNVAKADSAAKSLELTTTVRFYNSSLSGYFYLNFDTIFSAVGTTVVPTIDASKITWPTAA